MVTKIGQRRRAHLYITEWMDFRGLSDDQLAGRLNTDRTTIWRWRTQQHRLNPDKIAAIAEALNCEPAELFRPPGMRSIDALVSGAPDDVRDTAFDVVQRLVGRPK